MSDAPSTALAELHRRLAALEDERAVVQTLFRYGHTIDYGRRAEWLDCFVEWGTFEVRVRGELKARYEGRATLQRFIEGHSAIPDAYHKHLLVEPTVSVDGDEASAQSYFVRLDDDPDGAPRVHGFGRYVDRLVRGGDGRWRFLERIAELEAFDSHGSPGSWEHR